MPDRSDVAASKAIQRRTGRTFHLATRGLPEWARHPTYVLYAFFRMADEVVDDPDPAPPAEQRIELERIREAALDERETDDPVLGAFAELRERHGIPEREIHEFIEAMAMDVDRSRYDTYEDLEAYLRGSSVAVAYMMLAVMDPEEKEPARPHAKALGEAFQLTNFLRDVREDIEEYDRIYLPRETLDEYGVTEEQIESLSFDENFAAAMAHELTRTEQLYHKGVAGIRYLPEDCQFAVLAAATLYAEHHRLIRTRGFDVLSARPSLSTPRRLWVLARTWFHWRRTGDPEATFYLVAPVEPSSAEAAVGASPDGSGLAEGEEPGNADSTCRVSHGLSTLVRSVRSWLPPRTS